ncbi:hypothetical protein [Oleiagrimonas sp. MCCC 1A03011]|nr:hypothetical protein [Oleiagrimonas sp. MCCC 1A03011]
MITTIVILILIAILVVYVIVKYNGMVKARKRTKMRSRKSTCN